MHIRAYTPADRAACLAVFDSNTPEFFLPAERAEFAAFLDALPGPYLVLTGEAGDVLACGGFAVNPHTARADFCWGMVRRTEHGRGLGEQLLRARLAGIRADQRADHVVLHTSQHTRGFYEGLGFVTERVAPNGYGPGLDRCDLRLGLAEPLWWRRGVVYQVYPRSFQDSDGDGVGDLAGITRRLDDLAWLGVDAVWISPFYPSPMADFGYDVADFCDVDPVFGTLADFDGLVEQAHRRGIRLVLDFIPNHTSDQHPWFLESRASRGNAKRDWYIWRDPAPDGGPPNNWVSNFGGPAWTRDEHTGQFYYHAYLPEQPDLNWRNPDVRGAMLDAMRFWLERGVDGFRIDALRQVIKDDRFRDNPPNPDFTPEQGPYHALLPVYTTDRPEVMDVVTAMRAVVREYGDAPLIGELYLPLERLVAYYGDGTNGVQLPFNFHLLSTPWQPRAVAELVRRYEALLPPHGWPTWVLGNHDRSRLATRLGPEQARVAAVLLLTLRGTPTLYYGDELGMRDVPIPPERVRDPWEQRVPGLGLGRDPERTPMQWGGGENAGFSTGAPWLPLEEDAAHNNVEAQRGDPGSLLRLYRRLLRLRRAEPALHAGRWAPAGATEQLLAYRREGGGKRFLVVLNFSAQPAVWPLEQRRGRVVCGTELQREGEEAAGTLHLRPHEGVVVELE